MLILEEMVFIIVRTLFYFTILCQISLQGDNKGARVVALWLGVPHVLPASHTDAAVAGCPSSDPASHR